LPENAIEYRELRWADFPSYMKLMLQAPGAFERATGLDQTFDALFNYIHRRGLWTLLALMRAVGRAPLRIFVGVDQGQVLGSAGLVSLPKAGYIFALVTDSANRGHGIATHILEQMHQTAHRQGRPWVALDVDPDNETAVRLYRKLGYEERARSNWHVGPTPAAVAHSAGMATEVPRSKMKEVAAWVNLHQAPTLRDPFPANAKMLSPEENVSNLPNTQTKTWSLSSSDPTTAVVRAFYLSMIKSVFVIPAGWDAAITSDSLLSLVAPVVDWARSLGAARTVVVVPEPPGAWESAMVSLGLPKATSTTLMLRPSAP
jgi:ribosomal protein S18 acetylase RimI-like enzyme